MGTRSIAGVTSGQGSGHVDTGNSLPAGKKWQFLYDDTAVKSLSDLRSILDSIYQQASSNKNFGA